MTVPVDDSTYPPFNRNFFDGDVSFSLIGTGALGGKARGLAFIKETLAAHFDPAEFPDLTVTIPTMTVVATDVFDRFMKLNQLGEVAYSDLPDDRIAHAFQKAELPVGIVGDLRALIAQMHTPLAIRSSSLLEDALKHPFAGTYATKMIPNNQLDVDTRFRKLAEAIKFVWASTFFQAAKQYVRVTDYTSRDEKMAVIIQEVVGQRHGERFYPTMAGVARSYNYYPARPARPEEGVVNLALGLGKTIVDGGVCWTYSPAHPTRRPPFASNTDLLRNTQSEFWAVNMGPPPAYDPIHETEYLVKGTLLDAEQDGTLRYLVSTYEPGSDRLALGMGVPGPRALTFGPLLELEDVPLTPLLRRLLAVCKKVLRADVEMEFAVKLDPERGLPARFGFLQVRPMLVSDEEVRITDDEFHGPQAVVASEAVLGNGIVDTLRDVVYVKPDAFEARHTPRIAGELEEVNRVLVEQHRPYVLIGFGRWGSSDPWLGTPVVWPQISGARVIVEATLENMNVELSQGSHFFHNISSFRVSYLAVPHATGQAINWQWLADQPGRHDLTFVRHVALVHPLLVKVDARTGRGVILQGGATLNASTP
ncbi:MAG TPA: PEP/pyruvate-binding domain-containing protein [Phycisphaerae bacterium]|nr:PEP/pyruvate-binding domain-containing protein [Phycisphaerae bacterium]HNU45501.1 PEP/pyruvate-binding domain-containing protein [Phycisphaerae bacterium]